MKHISIQRGAALAALLALGLTACSGSGASPKAASQQNLSNSTLQFAVGTANVQGAAGLNVVTTYRQNNGDLNPGASAVLVSSPTLSGPFTLPGTAGTADAYDSTIATGPGPGETGGHSMTSTPQTGTTATTFGISGGVFGLGIEPFNYNENGVPDNVAPYPVPLYDTTAANQVLTWGGPPAFDPNGDGEGTLDGQVYPSGTAGISEGLDIFDGVTPVAGSYSLTVAVPSTTSGGITTTANATLGSAALLAPVTAPAPVPDGNGGLTFAVTMPADETEGYIQIVDLGPETDPVTGAPLYAGCHTGVGPNGGDPVYYTIEVKGSGTYTLGDKSGPLGSPSICTSAQDTAANTAAGNGPATVDGDQIEVMYLGFDYPAYEMTYPATLHNPAPAILGAKGQDDASVSLPASYTEPAAGGVAPEANKRLKAPKATRAVGRHR
jgi:hypothetical protein